MFLETTFIPEFKQQTSKLKITDVAILTAHIGDRPYLAKYRADHLTAGNIQLVCYISQGIHIVKTGRSLFSDDFYITNGRIENPRVTELFGEFDTIVTPFEMTDQIKRCLTPFASSFNSYNNSLVREIAYKVVPLDYKALMKGLRNTAPYINALEDPLNKISKKDIKDFFDDMILAPNKMDKTWSYGDAPIFLNIGSDDEEEKE